MITEHKFGPWLPDQADMRNPGLEVCQNVIPGAGGYKPALSPVGTGATVTGTIIGSGSFERSDGTPVTVCATVSDLFVIVGGSAQASSLGLSLATSDRVTFEQFNGLVFASVKNGASWLLTDIESDDIFSAATPPPSNAMGRVGDFLALGDMIDIDLTNQPYLLRWGPYNNPNGTYGTDIATQSGAVTLNPEHGPITAISGGTFGIVFQRSGISRMTYTGGATVFRLEIYEKNLGCIAPGSVVRVGDIAYYLSHDGFSQTDGSSVNAVSTGKIWEWFLDRVNEAYLPFVEGTADYRNRCIIWAFPTGSDLAMTDQLWFNWETSEWSHVVMTTEGLVQNVKAGLSLEQVSALYSDLDAMTISLDSPEFRSQGKTVSIFQGGELKNLTGSSLAAVFQGGDMQPQPGKRTFVDTVTPLIEGVGGNAMAKVGYRSKMGGTTLFTPVVSQGPLGFCDIRADGRYFSVAINIPAGEAWTEAVGYQIDSRVSGML